MTEAQIQESFVLWFDREFPENRGQLYANLQNPRSKAAGAMLVGQGLRAGVADLTLLGNGTCLFIEVKTETGEQSADQIRFQKMVENLGFTYKIVRDLETFQGIVRDFLNKIV